MPFLYCSACDKVQRSSVQVTCPYCRTTNLECFYTPNAFLEDPAITRLPATCHKCSKQVLARRASDHYWLLQANFSCKCVKCNTVGVPLPETVRENSRQELCIWCLGIQPVVVDLIPCRHILCTDCCGRCVSAAFVANRLWCVRGCMYLVIQCPCMWNLLARSIWYNQRKTAVLCC